MTDDLSDQRCQQCGGVGEAVESGGVTTIECSDCGNVLGLADPTQERSAAEATSDTAGASDTGADVDTVGPPGDETGQPDDTVGTVTAVDGEFDQLLRVLQSQDGRITASTLRIELPAETLSVTAVDGRIRIETDGGER
ncbi:uncharacterized protein NP_3124A [Natronomonas pharaonis DSM 2160]|uniref:Uncharacterized protein n=1 Tax=Natronomonas pharaonis (strain ATCC 35678 / DSM 2160 / CIP 103997 / JCM 8858 / NBRC 14720 / NCIMB 2260 / Gabara) TaxID=348780 RepID=A0A1U7EX07_NATPD|nr:hypothetical protein [Natronomonas pharaonis]CAI49653.1 uncharacterized protein NP_3124A [Natronomonas pharaonis DSM 2160]